VFTNVASLNINCQQDAKTPCKAGTTGSHHIHSAVVMLKCGKQI